MCVALNLQDRMRLVALRLTNRFAVRTGLEPVTPCVTGMYSNQLN